MAMADIPQEAPVDRPRVRREARVGWVPINARELWEYRELLVFYAIRDIKVRYKQTFLGFTWAILQPVVTMVVFSIFFGQLAGLPTDNDIPYPIFTLGALLPWQLFVYALTQSSNCLVNDADVLKKVYFPRLIMPIASVMAGLVDFAIAFGVLLVVMVYYQVVPSMAVLVLPAFVLLVVLAALAVGFWLSALNVKYRDVRYVIPFLAQVWMFASPVAYPSSLVPDEWKAVYGLNPMVGVIDGFRWVLLGTDPPALSSLATSTLATLVLLLGGLFFFRRTERQFADIV